MAEVYHGDLWGSRTAKNDALWAGTPTSLSLTPLPHKLPLYPFVARDYGLEERYEQGFSIADLMPVNSVGIVTARDALTIDIDRETLWNRVEDFTRSDPETLRRR